MGNRSMGCAKKWIALTTSCLLLWGEPGVTLTDPASAAEIATGNATTFYPASSATGQPAISARVKRVILVDGLRFKDLAGDGRLHPYEDWRLPAEARTRDLVARMSLDEKIGLMVIGTEIMGKPENGLTGHCTGPVSSDGLLCEADSMPPPPAASANGRGSAARPGSTAFNFQAYPTSVAILDHDIRRIITRQNPSPADLTAWTDRIQQVAESSRLGIPVVITSNPRNHASANMALGFNEASGQFTVWPGTLGLAASGDLKMIENFARIAASEWDATGLRAGYMYQADIDTDPRWFRIPDTFGDDPDRVSDIIQTIVMGFQGGPELSPGGIIMTTKHFPGGGARDRGTDPHFVYGQVSPYPTRGSLFQYHLPPFEAAIAAGTAAIIPYYARPSNAASVPQLPGGAGFEEVGFAFNRPILQDLLRNQLGFKGYVNSDSGILSTMAWGDKIEKADEVERAAYAINAGVDVISDTQDVGIVREAYDRGLITEARINLSAERLLLPMFQMGLFENPYRGVDAATKLVADPAHWAMAYRAHQESVVLLKNNAQLLPLTEAKLAGRPIFVAVLGRQDPGATQDPTTTVIQTLEARDPQIKFTTDLKGAAFALVFVDPEDKAVNIADILNGNKTPTYFDLTVGKSTGVDLDRLKTIETAVPTIVAFNLEMPWLIGTVEPGAKALVAGFSTRADAMLDVIRGRFQPQGRLPFTLPRNEAVVVAAETNGPKAVNGVTSSDVPGFARPASDNYVYKDATGAAYRTGFGLGY